MIDPVVYLPDLWRAPDPTRRSLTGPRPRSAAEVLKARRGFMMWDKGALAS